MSNIQDLSVVQLQRAIEIKEQIEALQRQLNSIMGGEAPRRGRPPGRPKGTGKRKMSAAGRKAIAAAARKRWAEYNAKTGKPAGVVKKKRKFSASAKAKIAAAARERWKKAKAEGKTTL